MLHIGWKVGLLRVLVLCRECVREAALDEVCDFIYAVDYLV